MTPDEYTIREFRHETGEGHLLYVQVWGNPEAKQPIIFLHGGPGAGCDDGHKQVFDPKQHMVVFFDQRGAGQSMPSGSLENNTTGHLIDDITAIADTLKLEKFVLFGGSWGSCLALAYALKHPERVISLVLRGIYTGSKRENDFIEQGEFRAFYPEIWERYLERTPTDHHKNPATYHIPRILGDDEEVAKLSAYAMGNVEGALLRLDDRSDEEPFADFDPAGTKILVKYTSTQCFMPDRYILKNAHKLSMPIWIVQGRYDMVCPPVTAHELHAEALNSQLIMTVGGHSGGDRANYEVLSGLVKQFS